MNKKIIFLDMDDTITELLNPWIKWLNNKYSLNVSLDDITSWDMHKAFPTLTHDEIYEPVISKSEEFWGSIEPVEDAQYYIQKLQEKYDVYIVTATNYKNIFPKVEYVLKKHFPFISEDNIIILHNKQLLHGFVMVDDYPKNLIGGNFHKILINKPYNKDDINDNYIRVDSWKEIYDTINTLDKQPTI